MGEFLKVLPYQDAKQLIVDSLPQPGTESLELELCNRRVLACEIKSPEDIPAFTRTTVDGYAVRAQDTFGSSESLPGFLNLIGEVSMGSEPQFLIDKGECCWIPTGGMLPSGADAAVMVEYTEKLAEDTVLIYKPVAPGENIMLKGEDVSCGQALFPAGKRLNARDLGLLASLGITHLPVVQAYRIAIISTGDEIVPIDRCPNVGQVRDVNSYSLKAAVEACGHRAFTYPLVSDDIDLLKSAINQALIDNDILLLTGGSSVGVMDFTLSVLLSFPEARLLFHGAAVRPGKPTLAVRIGEKLVVGLPGHPVSALMMFYVLCSPALGLTEAPSTEARLETGVASQAGRDDFIPVQLLEKDGLRVARPLLGKSGLMSILALAHAYIHIPYAQQGIEANNLVKVQYFGN